MNRREFKEMLDGSGFDLRPMPGKGVLAARPDTYQIVCRETGAVAGEVVFDPEGDGLEITMRSDNETTIFSTEG